MEGKTLSVRIIAGDCRTALPAIPAASIQCCVSSPPYFGLRDYGTASWQGGDAGCDHVEMAVGMSDKNTLGVIPGYRDTLPQTNSANVGKTRQYRHECGKCGATRVDQQIGLESTVEAYVAELVAVFRAVRRVLRDDGVLLLNLGDSYFSQTATQGRNENRSPETSTLARHGENGRSPSLDGQHSNTYRRDGDGLKPKDLIGIPWRVAFALQADGWWLRSDIIWKKPNPMPESVQGSHFSRHRVTIDEYERLSGLRYTRERYGQEGAGDLSCVQAREIPDREAQVSAEREGQSNGTSAGRTRGRAGEAPPVQSFGTREAQSGEVRGNGQGTDDQSQGCQEAQEQRTGQTNGGRETSAHQAPAGANRPEEEGSRQVQPNREIRSEETSGLRQAEASDCTDPASNGGGLARNLAATQAPMPLLPGTVHGGIAGDDRPRDSTEQERAAREGESRAGLPKLQLDEERQDYSSLLVDCPGCPKCSPHGGYILHMSAGRPTKAHEYIFLLTKSARYFWDAEAVREEHTAPMRKPGGYNPDKAVGPQSRNGHSQWESKRTAEESYHEGGRNIRSVWTIATEPFPGSHFAVFPKAIAERCIKAGTSEKGACSACGAPWMRVLQEGEKVQSGNGRGPNAAVNPNRHPGEEGALAFYVRERQTTGWQPTCTCDAPTVPCVVLDPFAGAGTVGLVADRLGRDAVLIELNPEYAQMARKRITDDGPLFAQVED